MLETAVYSKLSGTSAITDLVGSRIYPDVPKQGTELPFLIHTTSQDDSFRKTTGKTGTYQYTLTVDVYSYDFDTGLAVAGAVRSALDGWKDSTVRRSMLSGGGSVYLDAGFQYRYQFDVIAKP